MYITSLLLTMHVIFCDSRYNNQKQTYSCMGEHCIKRALAKVHLKQMKKEAPTNFKLILCTNITVFLKVGRSE